MPSSRLGEGHSTHAIITFETTAGHFAAAYAPGANSNTPPAIVNKAECRLKLALNAAFTVTGSRSTGAFSGAHGSGKAGCPRPPQP